MVAPINRDMTQRNRSASTDQEVLRKAEKRKSNAVLNALFIGFMIGIVVYSIINNTFGLVMLIPLFIAYKLLTKPKQDAQASDKDH
jgi:hypothetical protein